MGPCLGEREKLDLEGDLGDVVNWEEGVDDVYHTLVEETLVEDDP